MSARIAGIATETTEPSINPMLEARIAAASTNLRLADGQKVDAGVVDRLIAESYQRFRKSEPASTTELAVFCRAYSTNSTVTPFFTSFASSCASQLVRRMQPWLLVLPIFDGSGVPWMP